MVQDLDPDKPDPDPVWPDLDPAISASGSGFPGSRSGNIRMWIRLLPDLDPVAAGSKVPHGLSGPVQALSRMWDGKECKKIMFANDHRKSCKNV